MEHDVTVIITNYKTYNLTRMAVESLCKFYARLPLIVIDNGSKDASTRYIMGLACNLNTRVILNDNNIGHGPALHQGMLEAKTRYVLMLDSDCIVNKVGFIEIMYSWFVANPILYAAGWKRCVDAYSGVSTDDNVCGTGKEGFCWYIHPAVAMYDREKYITLEPFCNDGAPVLNNMRSAIAVGYGLEAFPVEQYVTHLVAGTRRMWGGRWDIGNTNPQKDWDPNGNYPI